MEARLPLERGDWAPPARLPVRAAEPTIGAALDHFRAGLGAARHGGAIRPQSRLEIAALTANRSRHDAARDTEWARVVASNDRR